MPTRRSVTALLAAAAVAVAGGAPPSPPAPQQAATGCKVEYKITNQWQGGFGADVLIPTSVTP